MQLTVNGMAHGAARGATLTVLLAELDLATAAGLSIAIAVNEVVIPRGRWAQFGLGDGDRVLIIQATQGG